MQWQHSKDTGNKKIHTGNRKMKSNTYSLPSGNFLNIQETRKCVQETEYSYRKQENEILAYSLPYTVSKSSFILFLEYISGVRHSNKNLSSLG